MSERGIAGRHVVEAMSDYGLRAAAHIAHCAACDQPHDELDALAAGLAHVLDVRHFGEICWILDQAIEKTVVPFLVDEPGTRTLQLMAHAAGAPDLYREWLVVTLHGPADSFAELEAAPARGRRI